MEGLGDRYDASVEAYEKLYSGINTRKYMVLLDRLGDGDLLEIGIGTGYHCGLIEGYGVGVDISLESLRRASRRCGNLDLIYGDVRHGFLRPGFRRGLAVSTCHHIGLDKCIEILGRLTERWAAGLLTKLVSDNLLQMLSREYEVVKLWDEVFILGP